MYAIIQRMKLAFWILGFFFRKAFMCFAVIEKKIRQRTIIKLCFKFVKSATEAYEMIKSACGDNAIRRTRVSECFLRFEVGTKSTKDNERSGYLCSRRN